MKQGYNPTTGVYSDNLKDMLRNANHVYTAARLTADWNLNRYSEATVENTPTEDSSGYDPDTFPISSLILPLRPTKGIANAIVGQSLAADVYRDENDVRFYVADADDVYKYWVSPFTSDSTGTIPLHTDSDTSCRPTVTYGSMLTVNKIVVKFENSWASPATLKIRTANGGALSEVINNPTLDNKGQVVIYWNGSAWTQTRPADLSATTNITKIQLAVYTMGPGKMKDGTTTSYLVPISGTGDATSYTTVNTDGKNSYCSVISIEPHWEVDMSSRLKTVNDSQDQGNVSQLYPLSTITSNVSSIVLDNTDSMLNTDNASSPFFNLLEPNVKFNLFYNFTDDTTEEVQQFEMYANSWDGQSSAEVTVPCDDVSKFLKDIKPNATMYENLTTTEIMWRILDSVGFNNYVIDRDQRTVDHTIPVWYCDGTQTVWQLLSDMAEATQTAIFVDTLGRLRVRVREAAFNDAASPVWTLKAVTDTEKADIVEDGWSTEGDFEANDISVKYRTAEWDNAYNGTPALHDVWSNSDTTNPDGTTNSDTIVVRSTQLVKTLLSTTTNGLMFVNKSDVSVWPWKSKVNIEGEIIQYDGKEFQYKDASGNLQKTIVHSQSEKDQFNKIADAGDRAKNYLTGGLYVTERGVWNTDQFTHSVDIDNWFKKVYSNGFYNDNPAGVTMSKNDSTMIINTPGFVKKGDDTLWAYRGSSSDTGFTMLGTRLRFENMHDNKDQRAGIAFNLHNSSEEGYYIELCPTNKLSAADRKNRAELTIYSRNGNKFSMEKKSSKIVVVDKQWYDIDIYYDAGSSDSLTVWLNGRKHFSVNIGGGHKANKNGRFALYARGQTKASFEYFYGVQRPYTEPADDFGFYDLREGGMRGGQWEQEAIYGKYTRVGSIATGKQSKKKGRFNQYIFDEFGPYVHEVREFNVTLDPSPVQYSMLFMSNEDQAQCLEYNSTPFSASFIVANVSRRNAILRGEDTASFNNTSNTVNMTFTVLGRDLVISDEESIDVKNPLAIQSRGTISSELASDWIQNKEMAQDISTWMAMHWSGGVDQCTVETFANPLLELGDIVNVNYPTLGMTTATHKYFVIGIETSWDNGVHTTLTLRRVRTTPASTLI